MSDFGDMYRKMAAEKRREAEEYEKKAIAADRREKKRQEAEAQIARTPSMTILAARGIYDQFPRKTIRSDDAYSQWEDTLYWHELSPEDRLAYIRQAENAV